MKRPERSAPVDSVGLPYRISGGDSIRKESETGCGGEGVSTGVVEAR